MTQVTQTFLLVSDVEQSRRFYEGALELPVSETGESSVAYETGTCELKIQADFEPGVMEQFDLAAPPADGRGAGAVHVLGVDEPLDSVYDRVTRELDGEAGEPLIEPREVPWGGEMFLVRDPDGYVFEIRRREE